MPFRPFLILGALLAALSLASSAGAYSILFYYSTSDAFSASLNKMRLALQAAGHTVSVVDVGNSLICPPENWYLYDQVWDARFKNDNSYLCGSPPTTNFDYFSACWQAKAQDYLENCGKLYLLGENAGFMSRDKGLYDFLRSIGAVSGSFTDCTGAGGNDVGPGSQYFTPAGLPGTTSYYTEFTGGIPMGLFNGTSYANANGIWSNVQVDRAVLTSWTGSQLSLGTPLCQRGRFFMNWDMSMFLFGPYDSNPTAKAATDATFAAVANWLGNAPCSCGTPTNTPGSTPSFTPTATRTHSPTATSTPTASPSATPTATPSETPSATPSGTLSASPSHSPTPTSSRTTSHTPTASPSPTDTPSPSVSPSATPSPSPSFSFTQTQSSSPTPSFTPSATQTLSSTWTHSPSATPTHTPSASATPSFTQTATSSATPSHTPSFSPTFTDTHSPVFTATATVSATATFSQTSTSSHSPSSTPSPTESYSHTFSPTPTATPSSSPTPTQSFSFTDTSTLTATPSFSATPTQSFTFTGSPTATSSPSASPSVTATLSHTHSPTLTASPTITITPVPMPLKLQIWVYNSAGERVRLLFDGVAEKVPTSLGQDSSALAAGAPGAGQTLDLGGQVSGTGSLTWEGGNDSGQPVESGSYYFKAEYADPFGATVTLIRPVSVTKATGQAEISIFNSAGELVAVQDLASIAPGSVDFQADKAAFAHSGLAGPSTVVNFSFSGGGAWAWDGRNALGNLVESGTYTVRLITTAPGGAKTVVQRQISVLKSGQGLHDPAPRLGASPLKPGQPAFLFYSPLSGARALARVYNAAGELIAQASDAASQGRIPLSLGQVAPGIYMVAFELWEGAAPSQRRLLKLAVMH